ncbi:TPA: conjugal transfer protein TraF [Candidatus Woesearchaeota archaeon]|nr:hypothetical protein QT06_C0001G0524 [archaeon GW2011_AR15]MBS3103835.1 hypothetical protein [Candidatus Woesearchaeota archaeon]HIH40839.1 conjugal transfer protein TraF [Candidatus Woesearchaeota archaeon]
MRNLSSGRYLFAAILTGGIFLLGLFLGLIVENYRLEYITKEDQFQKLDYNSAQLLYLYIDQLSQTNECSTIPNIYDLSLDHLEKTRLRLESYDEESKINQEEFEILRREYLQAQLRYWLLFQRIEKMCSLDVVTVLYFYSTDEACPDCADQAFILTYLKDLFQTKLMVFALDSNYEKEPLIPVLKKSFNITSYPAVVVGDRVYQGFTSRDELMFEICGGYEEKSEICEAEANAN